MTTTHLDEIRVFCFAYGCEWTPQSLRRAYEAIVASWTEAGFTPDKLGAQAPNVPGIGNKWGSFKRKRKRLEQTKFEGIKSFSISHMAEPNERYPNPDDLYPDMDWLVYASITTTIQRLRMSWIPALVGNSSLRFFNLLQEALTISNAKYGHWYLHRDRDIEQEYGANKTFIGIFEI